MEIKLLTLWLLVMLFVGLCQAEELPNLDTIPDTGFMTCSCDRQAYLDEWIYKLYNVLGYYRIPQRTIDRILLQILENRYYGSKVCR